MYPLRAAPVSPLWVARTSERVPCLNLIEDEFTRWLSIILFGFFISGFLLESVVLEDGSHEDIVTVTFEVSWEDSLISATSEHALLEWVVNITGGLNQIVFVMGVVVVESLTGSKTEESNKSCEF